MNGLAGSCPPARVSLHWTRSLHRVTPAAIFVNMLQRRVAVGVAAVGAGAAETRRHIVGIGQVIQRRSRRGQLREPVRIISAGHSCNRCAGSVTLGHLDASQVVLMAVHALRHETSPCDMRLAEQLCLPRWGNPLARFDWQ